MRFIGQDPATQPRRNLIINGTGMVNQRGYVSGAATSAANEYTLDRWRVVTSGQSLTYTGNDAGRTMTAPAGGVEQEVEGLNIVSGTYVLNWEGTATATVDGTSVTKGGTVTLTANTNATVRLIDGTFTEVQLELGSVATPFEHRSYGEELASCQRYYQKSYDHDTAPGTITNAGYLLHFAINTYSFYQTNLRLPIRLRGGSPVITLYSAATGASGKVHYVVGGSDVTGNVINAGESGGEITGLNNFIAGGYYTFHFVAEDEL